MARYLAVHSFKGGTGKSTVSANLAVMLAQMGKRVGVLDMDLEGPGIHVIFGVKEEDVKYTLNDVLLERTTIPNATVDLSPRLGLRAGKLFFVPASYRVEDIMMVLRTGFEVKSFKAILDSLSEAFRLDYLIVDTHPGIENDTVLSMGVCHAMLLVSRVDQQDILGTGIMAKLAGSIRKRAWLVFNMIPLELAGGDVVAMSEKLAKLFGLKVIASLPFYMDILQTLSREIFVLAAPRHDYAKRIHRMAESIINDLPVVEKLEWSK